MVGVKTSTLGDYAAKLGPETFDSLVKTGFHAKMYEEGGWEAGQTYYMGVPIAKWPCDLWLYQEQIWARRPQVIIETGTWHGGSALYFAHLLDQICEGQVVTLDITLASPEQKAAGSEPDHPRIQYIHASSIDPAVAQEVRCQLWPKRTMVILDSNHSAEHVLQELKFWGPLVTAGQLLVVEDTNVNGHPVALSHGPGPMEALVEWRRSCPQAARFRPMEGEEKFGFTFHPYGWLEAIV